MIRRGILASCLAVGAVALIGGCKPSGYTPVPPAKVEALTFPLPDDRELMPLKPGSRWVYKVTTRSLVAGELRGIEEYTLIFRLASSTPAGPEGTRAVMELIKEDEIIDRQTWLLNKQGLFQETSGKEQVAYLPVQPILRFPIRERMVIDYRGRGLCPDGEPGDLSAVSRILGAVPADSGIGRKSTVAVETEQRFRNKRRRGTAVSTAFFLPGTGIVRYRQSIRAANIGIDQVLELQAYTVTQS